MRKSAVGDLKRGLRPWVFVTEARFERSKDGNVRSLDGVSGDVSLKRYASNHPTLQVVARARAASKFHVRPDLTVAKLMPLTDYTGLKGLLYALPRLTAQIFRYAGNGLLIARLPGPLGTVAALSSMLRRRDYAVELAGDIEGVLVSGTIALPKFAERAVVAVTRLAVRRAAVVRYVTESALQAKYPSPQARVIGFSDVSLDPADIANRHRSAPHWSPLRLISVGSQETPYKGQQQIIAALPFLEEYGIAAELHLIGSGRHQQQLRDDAVRLGVDDRVVFHGSIPKDEVMEHLRSSDVYIQASYTEGLPRAVVEAMACALPVIGTDVGGIPELVAPTYLVPPRDPRSIAKKVRCLLIDGEYESQSRRSLNTARNYEAEVLDRRFDQWCSMLADIPIPVGT